jgi:glyoxylase-like metal-dependent hydrolase (beta-lactamase superfamily II)
MTDIEFRRDIDFVYGEPREIVPGVARIVANNPGPFTYKGTNTYLIGSRTLAVVDPGPDDGAHCAAILRAAGGRPISHIVLTHTHHDHYDGLPRLAEATRATVAGYGHETPAGRLSPVDGAEVAGTSFRPDVVLRDGDRIYGDGWSMTALFTPGHAPDHLCLALDGTGVTLSGDHVMAWNTSVVAPPDGSMAAYLASLERLIGRGDTLYLPGHGGRLNDPERMVRAYLVHRRMREDAILSAVRDGDRTIRDIVRRVYPDIDEKLVRAASLSVQAHVEHLIERRLVICDDPLSFDCRLAPG